VRPPSRVPGEPDWDWRALRERCLREAARVLQDPGEAEDVAQEAMLRAWRRADTCERAEARAPWIATIARREAHRWRTSPRGRQEPALETEELERLADATPRGDTDALLDRLVVRGALARLSGEERRLVALRYEDDLTQAAIADELSLPEGTVKVRLHRLRGRLKNELEQ
jgi:RNA polymerase sigma-70 factor (ECF subfamily)